MRLTIITVAFNDCKKLKITLDNLRSLKERNIEYILIDGGSQDGTFELAKTYSDVISKFVFEKDEGIYDAMNKGWALAKPDNFILFLGAGDTIVLLPDLEKLQKNTVFYGNVMVEGRGVFRSKLSIKLLIGNTLHHQALLIPKYLNPMPPFNCAYKIYADFDFNQRLYKSGVKFEFLDGFSSSAAADGVSYNLNINEMTSVVFKNFGLIAMIFSIIYLIYQKINMNFFK